MSMTVHDCLDSLREEARNTTELGRKFEELVLKCLSVAPTYHRRYKKIWHWDEWAQEQNIDRRDTGIDLVAEDKDGLYCAIQCKFFQPDHALQKGEIASFLAAANEHWGLKQDIVFSEMIVVSTAGQLSRNAKNSLKKQNIPAIHLGFYDLAAEFPPDTDWKKLCRARSYKGFEDQLQKKIRKNLKPHQKRALKDVLEGFEDSDRGQLIMACGTGKTMLSIKIAEQLLQGKSGNVLFLAPSLALISQTLHEWSAQFTPGADFFAVCSDVKVGKERKDIEIQDLAIPATTDSDKLVERLHDSVDDREKSINVIFSTYHSIEVVIEAQKKGAPDFALVICDEAHRTAGVDLPKSKRSYFTQVHDQELLRAEKRLYMTATPRIYATSAKQQGVEAKAEVYSMDDEKFYGKEFHRLNFSAAVKQRLLSDYRVLVLGVNTRWVSSDMQQLLAEGGEINLNDTAKMIGCWNGLAKRIKNIREKGIKDLEPMQRAVAFSRTIEDSERIRKHFSDIITIYREKHPEEKSLRCEIEHVDGTQGAIERNRHLQWLREDPGSNNCRILSNVRCLSEGVDVPALDAVLFLDPRESIIDIVQSVGRVMRKAKGKEYGYVILPVVIPDDVSPGEVLSQPDNQYDVVWRVLQALSAHDDRLNAEINQIKRSKKPSERVIVDWVGAEEEEGSYTAEDQLYQGELSFNRQWREIVLARIADECGDHHYWRKWAEDVVEIARRHITRIKTLVQDSGAAERKSFDKFLNELKQINPGVSEQEAIEMLAQHLITKPVFEALFENYNFASKNPVSKAMQNTLESLNAHNLETESRALRDFYESVQVRISGIHDAEGRQEVMVDLYEKFFQTAFRNMAQRLGIVYTPVEIVDFILHSVDWLLQKEFGKGISSTDVRILDPFTGTGTFINRLLRSSLIKDRDLERKFRTELHANEVVLLAYYIAAINIEEAYHDRKQQKVQKSEGNGIGVGERKGEDIDYEPFNGIVLTDTFQGNKQDDDMVDKVLSDNSERLQRQQEMPIQVILGNPPYSVGQRSQNDANKNVKYSKLDKSIRDSYAKFSSATLKRNLYDSYIRAFRWASNRIDEEGIIAYVSNGGWLDGTAMDGLRRCMNEEFSGVYCFNLRGHQRTSGELSRKEGGKIFGAGSRAAITILFLVKKSRKTGNCRIRYYDIGDYHDRDKKLQIIREFGSVEKIPWSTITPNAAHDWINQRNPEFQRELPMGDKKNKKKNRWKESLTVPSIFRLFSNGVITSRDAWVYNFSKDKVSKNMQKTIKFYNSEVERYQQACREKNKKQRPEVKQPVVDRDFTKIDWDRTNLKDIAKNKISKFISNRLRLSIYRPFCKQWLYFDTQWNNCRYLQHHIFPTSNSRNHAISVSGTGVGKEFSTLMVDTLPDFSIVSASQCFPRYHYVEIEEEDLYDKGEKWRCLDNIPSETVSMFREHYNDQRIDSDAIFYYVYGLLHSPEYKQKFAADLRKMLPRIPYAGTVEDFRAFSKAGIQLAEMHTGYEQVESYPLTIQEQNTDSNLAERYRVRKMRFGGKGRNRDRSIIQYNDNITIEDIPLEAYEYIVNGKSAVEWVMDRYQVTTHKKSLITNDPNQWSDDPRYIVDLLAKVVRVSVDTVKIVNNLPKLDL